jgi:hypothetical protein
MTKSINDSESKIEDRLAKIGLDEAMCARLLHWAPPHELVPTILLLFEIVSAKTQQGALLKVQRKVYGQSRSSEQPPVPGVVDVGKQLVKQLVQAIDDLAAWVDANIYVYRDGRLLIPDIAEVHPFVLPFYARVYSIIPLINEARRLIQRGHADLEEQLARPSSGRPTSATLALTSLDAKPVGRRRMEHALTDQLLLAKSPAPAGGHSKALRSKAKTLAYQLLSQLLPVKKKSHTADRQTRQPQLRP